MVLSLVALLLGTLVGFNKDNPPPCPDNWPEYEKEFGINYEDFYGEWFIKISTSADADGYLNRSIGTAYPKDDRYKKGYASDVAHDTCYMFVDTEEQIIFPHEKGSETRRVAAPVAVATPVVEPTMVPVVVPNTGSNTGSYYGSYIGSLL